jgi:bis(5'-nucleosyl)-tetraphosphatase (symmetrical)
MTTWAIGDIQGCMSSLERLLDRIDYDAGRDRLWLVGDLVNRGPRSLDVVRWARDQGDAVTCVLGNHDLHLLARAAGAAGEKKRDTLDELLVSGDRQVLIDWLRARPMIHVEGGWVMVHAGLHPRWTVARAVSHAREIESGLRGPGWADWIKQIAGGAVAWRDDLTGPERVRSIVGFLARVRMCDADGVPEPDFDAHPDDAPKGLRPWFALPGAAWADHSIVFGHWSALGLNLGPHHAAIDTGCVWGKSLTALRLEDRHVVQVKAVETAS